MKANTYPMPRIHCGARTRAGGTCRQPAMKNGRCRLHGGKSKAGQEHGRYTTGEHTKEAVAFRRSISKLLREARATLMGIHSKPGDERVVGMIARRLILTEAQAARQKTTVKTG